jgi:hypothetical protein
MKSAVKLMDMRYFEMPKSSDTQNDDVGYRGYLGIWVCSVAQESREKFDTLDILGSENCQQTSTARLDTKACY